MDIKIEAFKLAQVIVSDAKKGWSRYLNLSPYFQISEKRKGFELLAHLSVIPTEIQELDHLRILEIRGTKIKDLSILLQLPKLEVVEFEGIDACEEDLKLKTISEMKDPKERTTKLLEWLAQNTLLEPPEQRKGGPHFIVPDEPPVFLLDDNMANSGDNDQLYLLNELRIKAADLLNITSLSDNVAPRLSGAAERYQNLIGRNADDIGARAVWSHANTLESVLQVHQRAVVDHRNSEMLPISVASCLEDLLETHRVWFLGHDGAKEVEERASKYKRSDNSSALLNSALAVVKDAEQSGIVDLSALIPALTNIQTAHEATPSGTAALGELEDWVWNFVAAIAKKVWTVSQNPPGGVLVHSLTGSYLSIFVMQNEASLGAFAREFMAHGPIWWETVLNLCRRFNVRSIGTNEK